MPVNSSSSAKTVNEMYNLLPNDNWTIDKSLTYVNFKNKSIVPFVSVLDKYYDYFSQFLEEMEVPKRFYYSPSGFSENVYGTPDLDFLILYFAKITSLFNFNQSKIKVLPKTKLVELNKVLVLYKDKVNSSYKSPEVYYKPLPVSPEKKNYI